MVTIAAVWANHPLWAQLGLALTYFLWQGAAIALALALVLWLMRQRSAGERYVVCGLAMVLLVICPVATLGYIRANPLPVLAGGDREPAPAIVVPEPVGEVESDPAAVEDPSVADSAGPAGMAFEAEGEPAWIEGMTAPSVQEPGVTPVAPIEVPAADEWVVPETASGALTTAGVGRSAGGERRLARVLSLAAIVWCLCVAVLGLRLMLGWLGLRRLQLRDTEPLPDAIRDLVHRVSGRLGMARAVSVRATKLLVEPVAFGLLRPVVLLPVSLLTQCPVELIEAMIAHELAHIRRHDLWVNLFQRVVETLLFYHPAVWWVSGRMRLERELCCDDLVVSFTNRRADYAEALVTLSRARAGNIAGAWTMGMFGTRLTMLSRVRRVLQMPQPPQKGRYWLAGPLSLLLAGSLILAARIQAADPQAPAGSQVQPAEPAATGEGSSEQPGLSPETAPAEPAGQGAPQTSIIETGFSEIAGRSDAAKKQRAILTPALDAIKVFHEFREALYEPDPARLQRLFKRDGQPCSGQDVERLLADLRTLGLDEYREPWSPPWIIQSVTVPDNRNMALIECEQFPLPVPVYDESSVKMRLCCWLVADKTTDWAVTKLSVLPRYSTRGRPLQSMFQPGNKGASTEGRWRLKQGHPGLEDFVGPLCEQLPDNGSIIVYLFLFTNSGNPSAYYTLKVIQVPESKASFSRGGRGFACDIATRPEIKFSGPIPELQCFPGARDRWQTASVRTWTDGIVAEVTVKNGDKVKKGDLLVRLDNAEIEIELHEAIVRLRSAEQVYKQLQALSSAGKTPLSRLELQKAESAMELARLNVERCQLRLSRTLITSPADGTVHEVHRVRPGQAVAAGDSLAEVECRENVSPPGVAPTSSAAARVEPAGPP